MKIIKRSGCEVDFDITKIIAAITKGNNEMRDADKLSAGQIREIAIKVENKCKAMSHAPSVEEIQDLVEEQIMAHSAYALARSYITYRYTRSLVRKSNTTDEQILALIECNNEEVKQENSNKNPTVNSVQRDYMAGEVSKDITKRILLPQDIVEAHEQGIIHFHDADYFAQHMHNCDLVNLEDMLQNGTVISGTMIEKPHSFSTACNIATQIIAQVASSQYGGQSISLTHLAPFVDVSRKKIRKDVESELALLGTQADETVISKIVEKRLRDEINKGVQMIQYQVVTLMTTNGQAPFVTVFMYLGEAENERTRADLAIIIEEMLQQRIQGVKNEAGVWITPAFPKLIYVLEEAIKHALYAADDVRAIGGSEAGTVVPVNVYRADVIHGNHRALITRPQPRIGIVHGNQFYTTSRRVLQPEPLYDLTRGKCVHSTRLLILVGKQQCGGAAVPLGNDPDFPLRVGRMGIGCEYAVTAMRQRPVVQLSVALAQFAPIGAQIALKRAMHERGEIIVLAHQADYAARRYNLSQLHPRHHAATPPQCGQASLSPASYTRPQRSQRTHSPK